MSTSDTAAFAAAEGIEMLTSEDLQYIRDLVEDRMDALAGEATGKGRTQRGTVEQRLAYSALLGIYRRVESAISTAPAVPAAPPTGKDADAHVRFRLGASAS